MLSNHVILSGHLGADPKAITTTTGKIFAAARLAVSKRYTDRSGNTVDDTQWFNIVTFGSRAERMLTQLHCGDRVRIEGRLRVRSFQTEKGERRETMQIVVTSFERLPKLSDRRAALVELLAEAESSAARDSILDTEVAATVTLEALPAKSGTSVVKATSAPKPTKRVKRSAKTHTTN